MIVLPYVFRCVDSDGAYVRARICMLLIISCGYGIEMYGDVNVRDVFVLLLIIYLILYIPKMCYKAVVQLAGRFSNI